MKEKYSRRRFLRALGASPALLPLLEPERAAAGCLASGPKRFVAVLLTNGVEDWPSSGPAIDLPESLRAVDPYKKDFLFVSNVRYEIVRDTPGGRKNDVNGHGAWPALLTGRPYPTLSAGGTPSIDQHIASGLQKKGYGGLPSLNLGVLHRRYHAVWREAGQPLAPDNDPFHVYEVTFAGRRVGSGGGSGEASAELRRKLEARKSLLDHLGRDLERFRTRFGAADRLRIDAHLESVRQIERQLGQASPGGAADGTCAVPEVGAKVDVATTVNLPRVLKLQMDLLFAAMAADVTRVGTIQVGDFAGGHIVCTWLGFTISGRQTTFGDANGFHPLAHAGGASKRRMDAWFFSQWAYLIEKFRNEREGERSMLDNAVLAFGNTMEKGGNHDMMKAPWLIAGSGGGYFRTGRSVAANGAHNRLLVAFANAMDVPTQTFGDAKYGGELTV